MTIGLIYIIIYFNLFTFGYTIKEYLTFILQSHECYLFVIGFFIEIIMLFLWKEKQK